MDPPSPPSSLPPGVKGSLYELQEIYGMEPGRPVDVVDGFDDVEVSRETPCS